MFLVMEVMGPAYRIAMGILFQVFFSLGFMVDTGVAYAIREWRVFQFVISVPTAAMLILIL